jgi:hypothetical protein
MSSTRMAAFCAVFMTMLAIAATPTSAAENLGEVLRQAGWHRIIGTWVDADTKGANSTTTYAWRFKDKVIEVTSKIGEQESVSLMGLNRKTGEVYNLAADNQGSVSLGKWEFDEKDAALELGFVSAEGEEGGLSIRYRLEDDNTMTVTIGGLESFPSKLVRAKE